MKRWLLLAAIYLTLALAFAGPLLPHFTSAFPHDAGNPLLNTWLLWWSTQHMPLTQAWWNAPMFYPAPDAMALSEVLIGVLPISVPIQWITHSPLAAYNGAFVLSLPLSALAVAALAFELTRRWDAAALAGLAFAFAPYRATQLAHLQMLAYYWAPLALVGLHRYLRTRERRWLALFATAWLLQALTNGYALFHLSVLIVLWVLWFVRTRRDVLAIAISWGVAAVPVVPLLLKYQQVHDRWHLFRDINEIRRFSLDLADFFRAPQELVLWSGRLLDARAEGATFPGATVLLIGLVWAVVEWRARRDESAPAASVDQRVLIYLSMASGLVALSALTVGPWRIGPLSVTDFHKPFSLAVYARVLAWLRSPMLRAAWVRRSTVAFYVVAMAAMYLLAMGPEPRISGRPLLYEPPYAWLMRLPGFATLRVPARFAMLAVLCQSVLLACAVTRWRLGRRQMTVASLAAIGLLAEGWAHLPIALAPEAGPGVVAGSSAVVELPLGVPEVDFAALYHQMAHQRPILNGYSGYDPPHYLPLKDTVSSGHLDALADIDRGGAIEVAINRGRGDSPALAMQVEAIDGVQRLPAEERWLRYLMPQRRRPLPDAGAVLAIVSLQTNMLEREKQRMNDGDIETAWRSGTNQIGNEEVIVDLGLAGRIGSIVFEMGAFAFGYARDLAVDVEQDNGAYVEVWRGNTLSATLRAALERSDRVPLTIDIGDVYARRLRLRQLGSAAGIPWWIPESTVHAPAGPPAQ